MPVTTVTIIVIRQEYDYPNGKSYLTVQVTENEHAPSLVLKNKKAPREEPQSGLLKPDIDLNKLCAAIELVIKLIGTIGILGGFINSFISQ